MTAHGPLPIVGQDPASDPNARTLTVYGQTAHRYAALTETLDTAPFRRWLTDRLPTGAQVLDAGCGWGRDARAFQDAGYRVSAFDGCPELAALASARLGQDVPVRRFQELDALTCYDAIWARASLLHLPPDVLADAWARLMRALRPGGWCYASFKHGDGERWDDQGRYYLDMTVARFVPLLRSTDGVLVRVQVSADPFGRAPAWLNLLVRKVAR